MTDTQRLDVLHGLMTRTEVLNPRVGERPVGSDLHLANGSCSLYVRDLYGAPVAASTGADVRAVIDAVAQALGLPHVGCADE